MSIIYFVLMLGGLIFFHEFGHFLIARLFGVRVLEFSIGFGPKIGAFERGHTTYRIGLLPLGGYVKMLGADPLNDAAEEVAPPDSFARKPLWQRSLIVLAGPVFNFILPLPIFFLLFLSEGLVPPATIGTMAPDGVAARAGLMPGDAVRSIDGDEIHGWWQLERAVSGSGGKPLTLGVERDGAALPPITITPDVVTDIIAPELGLTRDVGRIQIELGYRRPVVMVAPGSAAAAAGLQSWDEIVAIGSTPVDRYTSVLKTLAGLTEPTPLRVLRRVPMAGMNAEVAEFETRQALTVSFTLKAGDGTVGLSSSEFVIADVAPDSAAAKAGLAAGDEIIAIDGMKKSSWGVLLNEIRSRPGERCTLTVRRHGEDRAVQLTFDVREEKGEFNTDSKEVVIGLSQRSGYAAPEPVENQSRLSFAAIRTWTETTRVFALTAASLAGLFTGKLGIKSMGGPIFIYEVASRTDSEGWNYFFTVMAWLSISLGLINLVPIPVLDGGHLLLFLMEGIRRRPLSLRTRQIAFYIGFSFIAVLMVLVFRNDIMRAYF
ncbi:MAG: RIP metalloprotease RseP [Myxococcales bacterium]|nr:RIP metalloprotease RseP [Myxococcales bacterium]